MSSKMTNFQSFYHYEPPKWKGTVQGYAKVPAVKIQLKENQRIMQVIKDTLTMAQNHMKQQAYQHRT